MREIKEVAIVVFAVTAIFVLAIAAFPFLFWHNIYTAYSLLRCGFFISCHKERLNNIKARFADPGNFMPFGDFVCLYSSEVFKLIMAFALCVALRGLLLPAKLASMRYIRMTYSIRNNIKIKLGDSNMYTWRQENIDEPVAPNCLGLKTIRKVYSTATDLDLPFLDKPSLMHVRIYSGSRLR